MSNCEHPLMDSMQSPACDPFVDRPHIEAERDQLIERHDTVLIGRQLSDDAIGDNPPTGRFPSI